MKKIIAIAGFFSILASAVATASAAYFNTTPIYRCETQITQTLQMGSQSGEVGLLQQLLVNSGYLHTEPNGYFGYQTQNAVRAFQANNSIRVTGVVGEATRNAVNERLCDSDLLDTPTNYNDEYDNGYNRGNSNGVTYVTNEDPFVRIISPDVVTPVIYNTPQSNLPITASSSNNRGYYEGMPTPGFTEMWNSEPHNLPVSARASSAISSTNIVYNPSTGYTYGIVPKSGSITVGSPKASATYNEGDTVVVTWSANGISRSTFNILFENNNTSQSRAIVTTAANSYSFVLTKELLDAVCSSQCNENQLGSFRVVISTPTTDIAGITSNLRAVIQPIIVRRPIRASQAVSVTSNRNPVNVNEMFRLYVNSSSVPYSTITNQNYSLRVRAICPSSIQVSIAGTPCGQDFLMPISSAYTQQEVPIIVTNNNWFKQEIGFNVVITNQAGQTIGTAQTTVSVNAAPFNW